MALIDARSDGPSRKEIVTRALIDTILQFEGDNFHRTVRRVMVHFVHDLVLLRLQGVLSPAERSLAESREGQTLMRQLLLREFDEVQELLALRLNEVLAPRRVRGLSVDLDAAADERLIICRLDGSSEELLAPEEPGAGGDWTDDDSH